MRWLAILFLLTACSTGYKPRVENIQLGQNSAGYYLSSYKGKDTVHLYLNLNLVPTAPSDLQITVTSADEDSLNYKLLKIAGPTKAPGVEGEHWIYYFYATPCHHVNRRVRVTLSCQHIKKTFLLESYHHIHLLS